MCTATYEIICEFSYPDFFVVNRKIVISKGLDIHREVKINDKTELDKGVMTTPKHCSVWFGSVCLFSLA